MILKSLRKARPLDVIDKLYDITVGNLRGWHDRVVISYEDRATKEQLFRCVPIENIENLPWFITASRRLTVQQRMRRQTLIIRDFNPYLHPLSRQQMARVRVRGVRVFARVERGKTFLEMCKISNI